MTNKISSKNDAFIKNAQKVGLSPKASSVYVTLLDERKALSPKIIIQRTNLHRQYVYDALKELQIKNLIGTEDSGRSTKYVAYSPERISKDIERKRIDTLDQVSQLMALYERKTDGVVQVISGKEAVIEADFSLLESLPNGITLDIIGGAGMKFVDLFGDRIEAYKDLQKEKKLKIRYIGGKEDVEHNMTDKALKNESKYIEGIENMVNVCIWPNNVSYNIYEPETLTVRVISDSAVKSQKALFEVLWKAADKL